MSIEGVREKSPQIVTVGQVSFVNLRPWQYVRVFGELKKATFPEKDSGCCRRVTYPLEVIARTVINAVSGILGAGLVMVVALAMGLINLGIAGAFILGIVFVLPFQILYSMVKGCCCCLRKKVQEPSDDSVIQLDQELQPLLPPADKGDIEGYVPQDHSGEAPISPLDLRV